MKVLQKYVAALLAVVLTAACATPNVQTGAPTPPAPAAHAACPAKTRLPLEDKTIQKHDKAFQKYLKKRLAKKQESTLTYAAVRALARQKPLAKITRTDGDYILVFADGATLRAFTYDANDKLFGWAESEFIKNTSAELTAVFYDYRLQAPDKMGGVQGKLKYILFLNINKKHGHFAQFIYDADATLLGGQTERGFYVLPSKEDLFIPASAYSDYVSQLPPDVSSVELMENVKDTVQIGVMAAAVASAFSALPSWIWMGYVGAAGAPWIVLMLICFTGACS